MAAPSDEVQNSAETPAGLANTAGKGKVAKVVQGEDDEEWPEAVVAPKKNDPVPDQTSKPVRKSRWIVCASIVNLLKAKSCTALFVC